MKIIEDFWPRVLGAVMWFLYTLAWPMLASMTVVAIVVLLYSLTHQAMGI